MWCAEIVQSLPKRQTRQPDAGRSKWSTTPWSFYCDDRLLGRRTCTSDGSALGKSGRSCFWRLFRRTTVRIQWNSNKNSEFRLTFEVLKKSLMKSTTFVLSFMMWKDFWAQNEQIFGGSIFYVHNFYETISDPVCTLQCLRLEMARNSNSNGACNWQRVRDSWWKYLIRLLAVFILQPCDIEILRFYDKHNAGGKLECQ